MLIQLSGTAFQWLISRQSGFNTLQRFYSSRISWRASASWVEWWLKQRYFTAESTRRIEAPDCSISFYRFCHYSTRGLYDWKKNHFRTLSRCKVVLFGIGVVGSFRLFSKSVVGSFDYARWRLSIVKRLYREVFTLSFWRRCVYNLNEITKFYIIIREIDS